MPKKIKALSHAFLTALGVVAYLLFLAVGLAQFWLGWIGIEYHFGTGWAVGALLSAFFLRIMLPISIGSYFGVVDVIGWPWWAGVLIAAPGLVFVTPALITSFVQLAGETIRK